MTVLRKTGIWTKTNQGNNTFTSKQIKETIKYLINECYFTTGEIFVT